MGLPPDGPLDIDDLKGQAMAKRAMEIAAAGGHHLALIGPTGCGKSSLAHAFAALVPGPTIDQAEKISALYREAGRPLPAEARPKRLVVAPCASSTPAALAGSGSRIGTLALAHHGLLILDDAHRCPDRALDVIRAALDRGEVQPGRGAPQPSRFQMLVTARSCRSRLAVTDRIEGVAREILSRAGETPAALVVIGYDSGPSNEELRRILGLSHPGSVRLVDRLVADGLAERRGARDRRAVALHLTEQGKTLRDDLLRGRLAAMRPLLSPLTEVEQEALRRFYARCSPR